MDDVQAHFDASSESSHGPSMRFAIGHPRVVVYGKGAISCKHL